MRLVLPAFVLGSSLISGFIACGDDGVNRLPDGPPLQPDAATDGPQPDAPNVPVTVNVRIGGQIAVGTKVYFQGPDSSLIATVDSDATGTASAVMPNGGWVTVVVPQTVFPSLGGSGTSETVKTWANVKPGDTLYLDEAPSSNYDSYPVNVPSQIGATYFYLETTCDTPDYLSADGSGQTINQFAYLSERCATTPMDAHVRVDMGSGGPPKSLFLPNYAPVAGQAMDITGTYTDYVNKTFSYTNVPSEYLTIYGEYYAATTKGWIRNYDGFNSSPTAGAGMVSTPIPPIPGALPIEVINPWGASTLGDQYTIRWGATEPYTFDVGASLLRDFATSATFDPTTKKLTWTATSTGLTPDTTIVSIGVDRTTATDAGPQYSFWYWDIVSADTGAEVQFPTLPPEITVYQPIVGDNLYIYDLVSVKNAGGYDGVRGRAFSLDVDQAGQVVAGASGQFSYVSYFEGSGLRARQAGERAPKKLFLDRPVRRIVRSK